jgi:hypothetical protein
MSVPRDSASKRTHPKPFLRLAHTYQLSLDTRFAEGSAPKLADLLSPENRHQVFMTVSAIGSQRS